MLAGGGRVRSSAAIVTALVVSSCSTAATADLPVLGADLSYVNEVEDCGGTYHDVSAETDPFAILAAHGVNLVRARLWHTPTWTDYSTLDDVIRTFERAEAHGMATLLDFHYSDEWADPGRQTPPAAWADITDIDELAGALGDYTADVLARLDEAGVFPDMVQIGNEINGGLVKDVVGLDWEHDAPLLTAGVDAARAAAAEAGTDIDVVLHVAQPENGLWWFAEAETAGLPDFDIIGLSYYPQWSRFSVAELGSAVEHLTAAYGKPVLIVEAGYPWTAETAGDTADNVLDQGLREYPVSPQGQRAFMEDLTAAVVANGGMGTVYWELAWLSTDCYTRWGQGSHWENATLFDFNGNLHDGAGYLSETYPTAAAPDAPVVTFADTAGDASDPAADLTSLSAAMDADVVQVAASLAGDVLQWPGAVSLVIDTGPGGGDGGRRPFDFAEATRPELVLETSFHDEPGVGYASPELTEWIDGAWADRTFTGSVRVESTDDEATTVTWTFPRELLGDAAGVGVTVLTVQRGRAGGLEDLFGPDGDVATVLSIGDEQ